MSQGLIGRSPDLCRLRNEGFAVEEVSGYLLVHDVPYVNERKEVARGILVSKLQLQGNVTAVPTEHVALWAGDQPCDAKGSPLANLIHASGLHVQVAPGIEARFDFSQKPEGGYKDYHQKVTAYIGILGLPASELDPNATAKTLKVFPLAEDESVFRYIDTASSRAGIVPISDRLASGKIAIVGLGGTGSYVLDLVAKTPVSEIHLFDSDHLLQHSAFRSPGAPSCEDLSAHPTKVAWFSGIYSRMRRGIVPHETAIEHSNLAELNGMGFVFLCMDGRPIKADIIRSLIDHRIPFIDVGMGIEIQAEKLGGLVRTTTYAGAPAFAWEPLVPLSTEEENEYATNIQVADLNCLNAAMAVIKWKKMREFYLDLEHEAHSLYSVSGNLLTNDGAEAQARQDPS